MIPEYPITRVERYLHRIATYEPPAEPDTNEIEEQ